MNNAEQATKELINYIDGIQSSLSEKNLEINPSLDKDRRFLESVLSAIKSEDQYLINEHWKQIQNLSKFFGGSYVSNRDYNKFERLCENLFDSYLDLIAHLRGNIP